MGHRSCKFSLIVSLIQQTYMECLLCVRHSGLFYSMVEQKRQGPCPGEVHILAGERSNKHNRYVSETV